MKNKCTNKNGVKLLAAIMAFAMVLVAGFVVIGQDESYAEDPVDATGVETWTTSSTVASGGKYYIPTSNPEAITIPNSSEVTFYVMTGVTLKVSVNSGETETVRVHAVSGAPVGDGKEIAFQNIAEVVVNATISAETSFTASGVSNNSTTTYASGVIEAGGSGMTVITVDGYAMQVDKAGSKTWYSKGAITDIEAGATGGPTSAVLKANVDGIDVAIGSGDGTTNTNEFRLTAATLAEDLSVTFGNDNEVKVKVNSGTQSTLTKGMLTITKGTVKVDTSLYLTPGTFAGVAPEDLSDKLEGGELRAELSPNEDGKLTESEYVFNMKVVSEDGIKLGGNTTISFMQGSEFGGKIIGTKTDGSESGIIDLSVAGKQAGRNLAIKNDPSQGSLTVEAKKTLISLGKTVAEAIPVGSEFYFNGKEGEVSFNGTDKDAVALPDTFNLEPGSGTTGNMELDLSGWTLIIPRTSTISLQKTGEFSSIIKAKEVYVYGNIEGSEIPSTGNFTATNKYYTRSNESTVKSFLGTNAEMMVIGTLSGSDALYVISEALKNGWQMNKNTTIDWTGKSAVYTTEDGNALEEDRSNLAKEIDIDAFEGIIKGQTNGTTVITVVQGTTLTVSGDSTLKASSGATTMELEDGSELVIKNSNILMEVTKADLASVKVSGPVSEYGSPSTPISVGYMREATIKGEITGSEITVYGNLTVIDNAELSSKSTMDIMKGGNLKVDGEFDVIGGITFNAGSTGTVNGTMNIGTTDGGTTVEVTGSDLTVSKNGKVKVVAPRDKNSSPNTLEVANSTAGVFKVEGTLDVRGTIEAYMIHDIGTVVINGQSVDTSITIYDGITLTLGSVSGKVTVTDENVMKDAAGGATTLSDGNTIEFENVTGITVSEAVSSKTYTEDNQTKRLYVSDMTLAGTVGAVNGTGSITLIKTGNYVEKAYTGGKVEISGEVTLGEGVTFTSKKHPTDPTNLVISGTVTCIAKTAEMVFEKDTATTVSGSIVVKTGTGFSFGLTGQQYLSATEFVIDDVANATKTTTYTTFENAVAEIAKAEDMTVTAYGSVSTAADNEIPKDATLVIEGTLTVSKGNTLTAKVGSNIEGTAITVSGTFTVEDYRNDLDVRTVSGDVVSVNGDAKTWTSLANALTIVAPGSVITADKPVELGSVTIPADVTVETEYDVTIKKNSVLTVDGTLTILKGTIKSKGSSPDTLGKLVVGKTGAVAVVADDEPNVMKDVSGAHFEKLVGAKNYCYVSNVDFAVKAIDEKLQSEIRLIGEVDVGDVTFTKTDKMTSLVIAIEKTTSTDLRTVVGGNITLVGAKLTIDDGVMFSGSVSAASDVADTEIGFEEASDVVIESYTDTTVSTPVSYMLFDGASANGKVTIVSGTVTVGKIGTSMDGATVNTDKDLVLTVAEGATLQVPQNSTINVDKSEKGDKATFIVDGNLVVKKGTVDVKVSAIMNINGTTVISDSANVKVNGTLNVLGTVTVSDEVGKEGVLTNHNVITVGSKPTALGAAGTIDGKVKIMAGYVLIYDGKVGKIVSSSDTDAKSTLVTINGVEYVKIVGNGDVRDILDDADIKLTGINGFTSETKIYSDEAMTQEITGDFAVGEFDAVYFELKASVVKGLVSVGTGIEVFIDGAKNAEGGIAVPLTIGTHTVDYNILTGYDGKNVVITFNGQTVQKGGQITITADMKDFSLIVTGATPAETVAPTPVQPAEADDGMDITDYLLIVLVVLAAILVVIVAIRMLRN